MRFALSSKIPGAGFARNLSAVSSFRAHVTLFLYVEMEKPAMLSPDAKNFVPSKNTAPLNESSPAVKSSLSPLVPEFVPSSIRQSSSPIRDQHSQNQQTKTSRDVQNQNKQRSTACSEAGADDARVSQGTRCKVSTNDQDVPGKVLIQKQYDGTKTERKQEQPALQQQQQQQQQQQENMQRTLKQRGFSPKQRDHEFQSRANKYAHYPKAEMHGSTYRQSLNERMNKNWREHSSDEVWEYIAGSGRMDNTIQRQEGYEKRLNQECIAGQGDSMRKREDQNLMFLKQQNAVKQNDSESTSGYIRIFRGRGRGRGSVQGNIPWFPKNIGVFKMDTVKHRQSYHGDQKPVGRGRGRGTMINQLNTIGTANIDDDFRKGVGGMKMGNVMDVHKDKISESGSVVTADEVDGWTTITSYKKKKFDGEIMSYQTPTKKESNESDRENPTTEASNSEIIIKFNRGKDGPIDSGSDSTHSFRKRRVHQKIEAWGDLRKGKENCKETKSSELKVTPDTLSKQLCEIEKDGELLRGAKRSAKNKRLVHRNEQISTEEGSSSFIDTHVWTRASEMVKETGISKPRNDREGNSKPRDSAWRKDIYLQCSALLSSRSRIAVAREVKQILKKEQNTPNSVFVKEPAGEQLPIFEDSEFPDLSNSLTKANKSSQLTSDWLTGGSKMPILSYSAALLAKPQQRKPPDPVHLKGVASVCGPNASQEESEVTQGKKMKKKKKRSKKKKAAPDGEDGKPQQNTSPKRTREPILFDLGEMLASIELKDEKDKLMQSPKKKATAAGILPTQPSITSSTVAQQPIKPLVTALKPSSSSKSSHSHNKLDSTAPLIKRGKEREVPKKKKPSALKKIILREREEKKKERDGSTDDKEAEDEHAKAERLETEDVVSTNESDHSDEGQGEDDDITVVSIFPSEDDIKAHIHSRRFREYCDQVMGKELNDVTVKLLKELVRFQDRVYFKDPEKAKSKRRFVVGLREVTKYLKLRKIKCAILAPNVERIESAGGLDDALHTIISLAHTNGIPVVFSLRRQILGRAVCKKVPVSAVGIFNYDGAQDVFKNLMELTENGRTVYAERWKAAQDALQEKLQNEKAAELSRDHKDEENSGEPSETEGNDTTNQQHDDTIPSEDSRKEDDDHDSEEEHPSQKLLKQINRDSIQETNNRTSSLTVTQIEDMSLEDLEL